MNIDYTEKTRESEPVFDSHNGTGCNDYYNELPEFDSGLYRLVGDVIYKLS